MRDITCRGLRKAFGDFVAVPDLSIGITAGGFVSILGPSGCGKTTTLRMLAGLEQPDAGEIRIGDALVSAPARRCFVPPEKRDIGMVFQSYAIWPHLTVHQNVEYPLKMRRVPKARRQSRAGEVLALVGLDGFGGRSASSLSGGQQQRVALARAIAADPDVLLLDEPLSNLDAKLRAGLRIELQGLQRQLGTTTVYVTHDQTEALALSDRIVVMRGGEVQQDGTPAEIYEHPANRFVAEFIGELTQLPGRVTSDGASPSVAIDGVVSGTVPVDALGDSVRTGSSVTVAFRPDRIRLCAGKLSGGDGLCLEAVVETSMYLGERRQYVVRAGDQPIEAYAHRTVDLRVGERCWVEVASADLMVFPGPAGGDGVDAIDDAATPVATAS